MTELSGGGSVDTIDERTARYVVEPLERGFGYTLGMRGVLLSSLPGAAVTSIGSRASGMSSPPSKAFFVRTSRTSR